MTDTAPTAFQRDRHYLAGVFTIYADRKAAPFISLRSGLSHQGGHIQHILSIEEAIELRDTLSKAIDFAAVPLLGEKRGA